MKNHKMNFTSEQLGSILQACEWAINDDPYERPNECPLYANNQEDCERAEGY